MNKNKLVSDYVGSWSANGTPFDTDWNWLMGAYFRCKNDSNYLLKNESHLSEDDSFVKHVDIFNSTMMGFDEMKLMEKIYGFVVDYIVWYNDNYKKLSINAKTVHVRKN